MGICATAKLEPHAVNSCLFCEEASVLGTLQSTHTCLDTLPVYTGVGAVPPESHGH